MRRASLRAGKYGKKVRGLVLKGQADRYEPSAAARIRLEQCVKNESITPALQFYYVAFLEELIKHDAKRRQAEGLIAYNKWLERGLDGPMLIKVADCLGFTIAPPAPPLCEWAWKRKLTFSGNPSATDLDDFPALVVLQAANFDFNKARDNGEDIRFMADDTCPSGGTPMKHEIEYWSKGAQLAYIWVKAPKITGGSLADNIYMFYGNPAAPDGQDAPGVWTNGYVAVYHLKDATTTTSADSTGNGYTMAKKGVDEPIQTSGVTAYAQHFDGTNDYMRNLALLDTGQANGTIEFWASLDDTTFMRFYQKYKASNSLIDGYWAAGSPAVMVERVHNGETTNLIVSGPHAKTAGVFKHYVFIWGSGKGMEIWENDAAVKADAAKTGSSPTTSGYYFYMGINAGMDEWFKGVLDEFRVSSVARPDGWIKCVYKSESNTLITYGAEQPA